jgi:hypothetical protein
MYKVGDKYVLKSTNGMNYICIIENINECREPSLKYALDVIDENDVSYYQSYRDYFFCGEEFMSKLAKY